MFGESYDVAMPVQPKVKSIIKRISRVFIFSFFFPLLYRVLSRSDLAERKVVFVENTEDHLTSNFELVYDILCQEYDCDLRITFLRATRVSGLKYFLNCMGLIAEISNAKYIFLSDASNIISSLSLRKETKVAQLWHACGAFKKFGMSTADLLFGGTREEKLAHPFYGNLSLVAVSSPEVIWAYAEAMNLEDRKQIIKPIGVSRTDKYFDESFLLLIKNKLHQKIPASSRKKIILYAPTFRGRVGAAEAPDEIDIALLSSELSSDYILLIKHHPFVLKPPAIPEGYENFAYLADGHFSVEELIPLADICITDYSSIIFEFSLFRKPIIFFSYDIDKYNDWRGFYYPYSEMTPGPVLETSREIVEHIKSIDAWFDARVIEDFCQKFMSSCDGRSSERVVEEFFGRDLDKFRKNFDN